jgi:hypothetical protein
MIFYGKYDAAVDRCTSGYSVKLELQMQFVG